jgi:hypothetical protein
MRLPHPQVRRAAAARFEQSTLLLSFRAAPFALSWHRSGGLGFWRAVREEGGMPASCVQ